MVLLCVGFIDQYRHSKESCLIMSLLDYFERMAIIHLPDRQDRFRALSQELSRIGIDINGPKATIPQPPMPEGDNGFPSKGIYGNFLSHLEILENAYRDGIESIWVLEDDAIFSERFRTQQSQIAQYLRDNEWDLFFIGHSISKGLPASPTGLLQFAGPFLWAHSYAVHRRIMPRLIDYLRQTIDREVGHPDGGKMYIDATYFLFRKFNPDAICIVTSPCLSVQKGSRSSLNTARWYDRKSSTVRLVNFARGIRDESWRQGWLRIGPKGQPENHLDFTSTPASIWPSALSGNPGDPK
jgi:glycosyl transferase, family 25